MAAVKVRVEMAYVAKWIIDEATTAGVEVAVRQRRGYDLVEVSTTNKNGLPDQSESFRFLRVPFKWCSKWRDRRLRRAVDRAFAKIARRYREWGVPEEKIRFPWKEQAA